MGQGGAEKNRVRVTYVPGQDKEDNQEPLLIIIIKLKGKVKFLLTLLMRLVLAATLNYAELHEGTSL